MTISTVGLIPGINRLAGEPMQVNLAVSLHAATDDVRNSLVPVNIKYPLKELIDSCIDYVNATRRRITFEWALIEGLNDTERQMREFVGLLSRFRRKNSILCHVNLIPLNPTKRFEGIGSDKNGTYRFYRCLTQNRIPCSIRRRKGIEIAAGCGQLAGERTTN